MVIDFCLLPPIDDIEFMRAMYPDLPDNILEINLRLFSSGESLLFLLKGENIHMSKELNRIKGKIHYDKPYGLQHGLRGLKKIIDGPNYFEKMVEKINSDEKKGEEVGDFLARTLVHTPDSYEERVFLLKQILEYKDSTNATIMD